MSGDLLTHLGPVASAPAILVTLVASVILLALRAWRASARLALTRRVSILLDGAITGLAILFLLLVLVRFKTLA